MGPLKISLLSLSATNKYLLSAGYTLDPVYGAQDNWSLPLPHSSAGSPDAVCSASSEPSKLQLNIQPTFVHLFFKCAVRHTAK